MWLELHVNLRVDKMKIAAETPRLKKFIFLFLSLINCQMENA